MTGAYLPLARIGEVSHWTLAQLLDAMYDNQVQLYGQMQLEGAIIYERRRRERWILGCLDYQGIVALGWDEYRHIRHNKVAEVTGCELLSPEGIRHWRPWPQGDFPLPNEMFFAADFCPAPPARLRAWLGRPYLGEWRLGQVADELARTAGASVDPPQRYNIFGLCKGVKLAPADARFCLAEIPAEVRRHGP